jgi:tetratricopeptide (TPR) repeat protein
VTARARVIAVTALAAAAAAGAVVGVTLATTRGEHRTAPKPELRAGRPPLVADATAPRDLRVAVARALNAWPDGTVPQLEALARSHPATGLVRLELGLAYFWARRNGDAVAAWRATSRVQPDSPSAVRAQDLLHPNTPPGLPFFVPSFPAPPALDRLPPRAQLAFLARRARTGPARAKLLYGVALQRLGHSQSAEREFQAAAALAPRDPEARVAAAVGRFEKANPSRAFSRLGPLVRTFPRAATVRFHLGLLLLWLGRATEAKHELVLARADAPRSTLGREADRLLARLAGIGTR